MIAVFVFGIVRSPGPTFDCVARPSLERCGEADTAVLVRERATSIAGAYNSILAESARRFPSAEATVLMHQDVEITAARFFAQVRSRLADPSIGLIGAVGAQGVRSIVYWRARQCGRLCEQHRTFDHGDETAEVDAVDGLLLVLSPACAAAVRFDETTCRAFHGYDIDFSFAVAAAGLKVVVEPLPIIHHTKGGFGDIGAYLQASRAWRRKWLSDAPATTRLASWLDDLHVIRAQGSARLRPGRRPGWSP